MSSRNYDRIAARYEDLRGGEARAEAIASAITPDVFGERILDVGVDLRKESPTYGKVFQVELSAENKKQLFLPRGFAHGFSVLSEKAEVLYKCDGFYNKQSEEGILYNDPDLKIDWQIPADEIKVSQKAMC